MITVLSLVAAAGTLEQNAAAQTAPVAASTVIEPSDDVHVPVAILQKLSGVADVRAFLYVGNQDAVVVYDTVRADPNKMDFKENEPDWTDNEPHVVFVQSDGGVLNLNVLSFARVGPGSFHGMAILPGSENNAVAAFAFTLGVDSSETFFLFVGRKPSGYQLTATLRGAQSQLRFTEDGALQFWSAGGQFNRRWDYQCVWCPKYYKSTELVWRNGKLRNQRTTVSKRGYQPDNFFEKPFVLEK